MYNLLIALYSQLSRKAMRVDFWEYRVLPHLRLTEVEKSVDALLIFQGVLFVTKMPWIILWSRDEMRHSVAESNSF